MFWWGPAAGWVFGLVSMVVLIALVVGAILLLRREIPHLRLPELRSPALRILEELYARGEISREDFLERREVLRKASTRPEPPTPPPPAPVAGPAAQETEVPPAPTAPPAPSGPSAPPGAASPWWPAPRREGSEPTQPLPEAPPE